MQCNYFSTKKKCDDLLSKLEWKMPADAFRKQTRDLKELEDNTSKYFIGRPEDVFLISSANKKNN